MTTAIRRFNLNAAPFTEELGDAELWIPPSKEHLVDDLCDAARARESVLLAGDPGVGKTCVFRALRHRLPEKEFRITYCHDATLGRCDFYRRLCVALSLTPSATAAALFCAVTQHVTHLATERLTPVFVVDEAQLLHQDVLLVATEDAS